MWLKAPSECMRKQSVSGFVIDKISRLILVDVWHTCTLINVGKNVSHSKVLSLNFQHASRVQLSTYQVSGICRTSVCCMLYTNHDFITDSQLRFIVDFWNDQGVGNITLHENTYRLNSKRVFTWNYLAEYDCLD